ncbi:unnamed protein product, partial [Ectocarpus sp. 4 AP-2014]
RRARGRLGQPVSFAGTHGCRSARPASTRQRGSPNTRSLASYNFTRNGQLSSRSSSRRPTTCTTPMRQVPPRKEPRRRRRLRKQGRRWLVRCARTRKKTPPWSPPSALMSTWAPTIIFKGERLQPDWFAERNGPPAARYTCTDSSFMQDNVFINYLKDFHKQLRDRGLDDGKPHVLSLDGHASHVSVEVNQAGHRSQHRHVPASRTSHITQPLDVVAFGFLKEEMTKVLANYYHTSGGLLPLKRDVPGVIAKAWAVSFFTPEVSRSSFARARLWPVDMERALSRLKGTAKGKERRDERPPLQDVPIAASIEQLEEYIRERG